MSDTVQTIDERDSSVRAPEKFKGKRTNYIDFLSKRYGGRHGVPGVISLLFKGANSISIVRSNPKLQIAMKLLSGVALVADMVEGIKDYKRDNDSESEKVLFNCRKLLNVKYVDVVYDYENFVQELSISIIEWLCGKPTSLNIIGMYDYLSLKPIEKLQEGHALLHVKPTSGEDSRELVIQITTGSQPGFKYVGISGVFYTDWLSARHFFEEVTVKYFDHIGWEKNVICFNRYIMETRERSKGVDFEPDREVMGRLINAIEKVSKFGGRRGVLITGHPGTGKTSIILEIENRYRNIPVVHVRSDNLRDSDATQRVMKTISIFDKCIVYFEDMDTFEIDDKTSKLAPVLELLDNCRNDASVVFIGTINRADMLDDAIVRPGRFDEICEVKLPKSYDNFNEIFKYNMEKFYKDFTIHFEDHRQIADIQNLPYLTYLTFRLHRLSHVEIREVIERLFVDGMYINQKNLNKSLKNVLESRSTIKRFRSKKKKKK